MLRLDAPGIPLESYRIIDDETGTVTEYLVAIYSLFQKMATLRHDFAKNLATGGLPEFEYGHCRESEQNRDRNDKDYTISDIL